MTTPRTTIADPQAPEVESPAENEPQILIPNGPYDPSRLMIEAARNQAYALLRARPRKS